MSPVSVVIMSKNEEKVIGRTLQCLKGFTDDIVLLDNGSTDNTVKIAESFGCRIISTVFKGYGPTKNVGIDAAKYDWILSLDSDECPDKKLLDDISTIDFANAEVVYDLDFKTYFGERRIKFGEWGKDHHIRLVNRKFARWSSDEVHEKLLVPDHLEIKKLKGAVHHYTIDNETELREKFIRYAELNAHRYFGQKKAPGFKLWVSPAFGFIKNYIFKLGFLDGNEGFVIAKLSAYYTWRKYYRLKQLNRDKQSH